VSFCWYTSFIGYPDFLAARGRGYDLAQFYRKMVRASRDGVSYSDSKKLFPNLDHAQVETKKAAFQEFGLLYVVPASNTISLTPAGEKVFELGSSRDEARRNKHDILQTLATALSRYQFRNPQPVGGTRGRVRARSTDVLPYLATWYLLLRLGGVLYSSEFRGTLFGLKRMRYLRSTEELIRLSRKNKQVLEDLPHLPANAGTANNLRIYFWSHVSLDEAIMTAKQVRNSNGDLELALVLTQFGKELLKDVLDAEWPHWNSGDSEIPTAAKSSSIDEYFIGIVGRTVAESTLRKQATASSRTLKRQTEGLLDPYDVEALKALPPRAFEEGRRRLIMHVRIEKVRNPSLIRFAKARCKRENGRLVCEICGFDFEAVYGERGEDYIEAHHREPISEIDDAVTLTIDDLAMICSNCHRMLHRRPWITVDRLKKMIR
jgi:HNH endonuclease